MKLFKIKKIKNQNWGFEVFKTQFFGLYYCACIYEWITYDHSLLPMIESQGH